jgi:hypothetical protein
MSVGHWPKIDVVRQRRLPSPVKATKATIKGSKHSHIILEEMTMRKTNIPRDANPDPLTGEPGSHPVGTGVGAAAGGLAAGAALGAVAGPVGAAVGAVAGAVAGGYGGKAAAEAIDPTAEETYWEQNYASRPYVQEGSSYEEYRPAYQYGWESRRRFGSERFDEVEPELARDWEHRRSDSSLSWDKAKHAVRDAWDRISGSATGTSKKPR